MLGRAIGAKGGIMASVLVAVLAFVVVNAATSLFTGARIDLTEDKQFTLSEGTRNTLRNLAQPVTLDLYYTHRLGDNVPAYGNYAVRVRSMLNEFANAAGGKVEFVEYDPEPFSEVEDDAVEAGLQGVPLDESGEKVYFGLVGGVAEPAKATRVIPFFQLERDVFMEYDLTRLIADLVNPKKKVVGVWTGLPMFGDFRAQMQGRPTTPWAIVEQLKQQFEVKQIFVAADLDEGIDALFLAHPAGLEATDQYAIDQYLMRGGRALIFLDPHNEASAALRFSAMPMPATSELKYLTDAWGIEIDKTKLAGDIKLARMVNAGGPNQLIPAPYITWLALKGANISRTDLVTGDINLINMASAGIIRVKPDAAAKVEPLIMTTDQTQAVDPKHVAKTPPDIKGLVERFKPSGEVMVLAARLSGITKSAFPDGPPKEKEPEATKPEDTKAGDKKTPDAKPDGDKPEATAAGKPAGKASGGEKAEAKAQAKAPEKAPAKPEEKAPEKTETKVEEKVEEKKPVHPHLAEAKEPVNIVLVADTDMLADSFWVSIREFFGTRIPVPVSHNGDLVLNALDNLAGSSDLIGLRSRGSTRRPFTKVAELQFAAAQKFKAEEQRLLKRMEETEKKIAQLQQAKAGGAPGQPGGQAGAPAGAPAGGPAAPKAAPKAGPRTGDAALIEEQKREIEKFTDELLATRKALRNVQLALRQDIDRLRNWLTFANIGLIPIVVALLAIVLGLVRAGRRKRAVQGS